MKWAELYAESAILQYEIDSERLKTTTVMEYTQYSVMTESAIGKLKDKLIEAIKKIFESAKKLIQTIHDKIQSLIKNKDIEKKQDMVDQLKGIPGTSNLTVEIEDRDERDKNIKSLDQKVSHIKSKFFSKKSISEAEMNDLGDAEKKASSPAKKITVGVLATAGAIIASLTAAKTIGLSKSLKNIEDDYLDKITKQSEKEQELSESNSVDTSEEQNMIKIARAEAKLKELEAIRDAKDAGMLSKILYPLASILSGNRDNASPERIKGAQDRLNELNNQ